MLQLLSLFAIDCSPKFLGLVPWYNYLPLDATCKVTDFTLLPANGKASDIPLVLLALTDDLLRIGGIVAVGYVLYGGVQYVISQGEPDKTARAQATVLNALIGLVIAIIAIGVVSFLGNKLGA